MASWVWGIKSECALCWLEGWGAAGAGAHERGQSSVRLGCVLSLGCASYGQLVMGEASVLWGGREGGYCRGRGVGVFKQLWQTTHVCSVGAVSLRSGANG
jgi:hypothetical protein